MAGLNSMNSAVYPGDLVDQACFYCHPQFPVHNVLVRLTRSSCGGNRRILQDEIGYSGTVPHIENKRLLVLSPRPHTTSSRQRTRERTLLERMRFLEGCQAAYATVLLEVETSATACDRHRGAPPPHGRGCCPVCPSRSPLSPEKTKDFPKLGQYAGSRLARPGLGRVGTAWRMSSAPRPGGKPSVSAALAVT
jgi:hypothetical protein